ncbi:hypothetical protein FACS189440_18360 [Bacteroidia bacterium]|nr:hypothetical protein FACS189440_18360 [Bacteroidia bacterium]
MNNVFWKDKALYDLDDCLDALMFPKYNNRPPFSYEEAIDYRDNVMAFAFALRDKVLHTDCKYEIHKMYGEKVARYERNKNTQYYIIYNIDTIGDIFIERIMTNHITLL